MSIITWANLARRRVSGRVRQGQARPRAERCSAGRWHAIPWRLRCSRPGVRVTRPEWRRLWFRRSKRVSSASRRQVSALLIFRLMGSFRMRYVARGVPYTIATSLAHSPSSKFQPRHSLTRQMAIHSLSLRAGCGLGRRTGNRRLGKIIIERLSIVNEPRSSLAPRHLFQRRCPGFGEVNNQTQVVGAGRESGRKV